MGISAKELAQKINISAATVSMVFNNKPGISDATKKLVFDAAKEYGYVPKKQPSQSSVDGSIQLVLYKKHGQVVSDTPFFSQLIEGITQECVKKNHSLKISYLEEGELFHSQLKQIQMIKCKGILLLATEMTESDFSILSSFSVPVVILDNYSENLECDCVLINNIQGAYCATSHLFAMGHTSVGHLASSMSIHNFEERAEGYEKALRRHQIFSSQTDTYKISPTTDQGYYDMKKLLEQTPPVSTAYFADNDIIAATAIRAFREAGYRVPEDISIIGFDNMPFCCLMNPELASMDVDKHYLGSVALNALTDRLENPEAVPVKIELRTTLVTRDSVKNL